MREKLRNFWYYDKWYVLAAALLLVLALNFIAQKKQTPKPDVQIAVVSMQAPDESGQARLSALAAEAWQDADGTRPCVQVNVYAYDADPAAAEDTAQFMAASVQLAADLQNRISAVYITDTPQLLLDADDTLRTAGSAGASVFAMDGYTILCREETRTLAQKLFTEGKEQ